MSAHTADEPAEAQRDSHRGIRPTFDSVAQKFFQRCSVFLHRPCCVANGIFRLPIRLPGCVLGLSINVLGGTGCLLIFPSTSVFTSPVARPNPCSTRPPTFLPVPANLILIHRHDFCSFALPPLLNNRSTIWFDARFKFARNAFQENALCAIIEEAHMPLSPEQEALCERLEKGESTPTAATLVSP